MRPTVWPPDTGSSTATPLNADRFAKGLQITWR